MQNESSTNVPGPLWIRWMLLLSVTITAFSSVLVPVLLIQPFKLQTTERLNLSYTLRHWSPVITVVALLLALLIVFSLWKRTRRWWRKGLLVSFFLPLLAATWFARQNHFEWMFKPLPKADFVRPNDANFISDGEMILAVELNGDAVAYPIRQIAYHHVVQDMVGGIPVLVTY